MGASDFECCEETIVTRANPRVGRASECLRDLFVREEPMIQRDVRKSDLRNHARCGFDLECSLEDFEGFSVTTCRSQLESLPN